MAMIKLIFWLSFFLVSYTYLLYPLLLKVLSFYKKPNDLLYSNDASLPFVSVLIPAFNEDKVIRNKIESIIKSSYPPNLIEIIVGSDNSTDRTNSIVHEMIEKDSRIKLEVFVQRTGKVLIINELVKKTSGSVLILTDANVMFDKDTMYELLKHFKNDKIALVDSNMINTGIKKDGISLQEKSYIKTEVYIKYFEGIIWGTMMGPFGGCYAIRKSYYNAVPGNFLVDDFYLNMKALVNGGQCINELNAVVFEDVSNDLNIEFKRKIRIAAGCYQNLFFFFPELFKFNAAGFCFFSHKVLRWLGPFIMLLIIICAAPFNELFYKFTLWSAILVLITPLLDFLFRKVFSLNVALIKFPAYFVTTNLALFFGFFKYINGIKSSIWQPTKRHQ